LITHDFEMVTSTEILENCPIPKKARQEKRK